MFTSRALSDILNIGYFHVWLSVAHSECAVPMRPGYIIDSNLHYVITFLPPRRK